MGKLENFNRDATLDISKPMISRSLVDQKSLKVRDTDISLYIHVCMYDITA